VELQKLQDCVDELNTTNSKNEKLLILAKYSECKDILKYVYHPYWQYGVTSKNIEKYQKKMVKKDYKDYNNLFELLDGLKSREITGHKALESVLVLLEKNEYSNHKDLIYKIIDKNIEIRMSAKSINKVFNNLVPEFKIALASSFEDHQHKIKDITQYYKSRKLDGCRLIIRCDEKGNVKFYSRKGKEFFTLKKIEEDLKKNNIKNCVFDGEVCIMKNNMEDFTAIVSKIRKKDYTIENPMFLMFDYLTLNEFDSGKGTNVLSNRLYDAKSICENHNFTTIKYLYQEKATTREELDKSMEKAVAMGYEGLILRKNIPYEGKRSRFMLKMKEFNEDEYIVINTETGPFRIINKTTGLEETIQTMTNVIIEHKGNIVSVGSGFSLEQRELYYNNPNLILGKEITINYFGVSEDKNGKESLRFPTLKKVWENKRNI
jgi:DNA ligase 1